MLRLSQLQCEEYVYREKNLNGSFKQLHINSKVVPMFPVQKQKKGAQSACISKLPPEAKEKDLLYVWPLDKYYGHRIRICRGTAAVPLGKHALSNKSRKCTQKQVSLGTRRIIASEQLVLRSCTRKVLLKSKLKKEPDTAPSNHLGHAYERTSEEQHKAASMLLFAPANQSGAHASYSHYFSSSKTNVHPVPSTSQGFTPVSFQNVQGCTINIVSALQPPLLPPQAPLVDFTEIELQSFFSE